MKKILITGCNGFLGSNLIRFLSSPDYQIVGTSLNENLENKNFLFKKGDLSDPAFTKSLIQSINPDIIINTVAWTDVDACELQPEKAYQLNVLTAENIAKAISNEKTKLIHFSSDQLFDGLQSFYSEKSVPKPINVYGKTKLEAESVCLSYHKNTIVIRTNFFGESPKNHKPSFAEWIFNSLNEKKEMKMFTDIFFNPIEVSLLVKAIEKTFSSEYSGILNIVGNERISKYDFGVRLGEKFGFDTSLIVPSKSTEFNFKAARPLDMSLSTKLYENLFNYQLPSLEDSLNKFVENKKWKQ